MGVNRFELEADMVRDAINRVEAKFGQVFGLRAFPGERFRIFESECFVSESVRVMLYTSVERNGGWSSFAKGTELELHQQAVKL